MIDLCNRKIIDYDYGTPTSVEMIKIAYLNVRNTQEIIRYNDLEGSF
ncbi:Uncharacterised protein [Eubacterium limosum]|uniref:Uncharacterized protein n=1 Tax=Eubacterium limosum TaxID=1736 RepID=A0A6N3HHB1_EUBLI